MQHSWRSRSQHMTEGSEEAGNCIGGRRPGATFYVLVAQPLQHTNADAAVDHGGTKCEAVANVTQHKIASSASGVLRREHHDGLASVDADPPVLCLGDGGCSQGRRRQAQTQMWWGQNILSATTV